MFLLFKFSLIRLIVDSDVLLEQDFTQVSQLSKYVWEYALFSAGKSNDMPEPKVCKLAFVF